VCRGGFDEVAAFRFVEVVPRRVSRALQGEAEFAGGGGGAVEKWVRVVVG
jgi:hypothetical protein